MTIYSLERITTRGSREIFFSEFSYALQTAEKFISENPSDWREIPLYSADKNGTEDDSFCRLWREFNSTRDEIRIQPMVLLKSVHSSLLRF